MASGRSKRVMYERVRVDPLEEKGRVGIAGYVIVLIVLPAFLLGLAFIKLNSEQVKFRRQLTEMRRDFGLHSKEQANLELEVEMYRNGSRIFTQIQRLGLGLRMPEQGQVMRVHGGVARPRGGSQERNGTELAKADREG
jgi:hypothetical protein